MMHTPKRRSIFAGAMVALSSLCLSSCGPLISFGDDGPAPNSYTLRYPASYTDVQSEGPAIYLDSPRMINALDSDAIAVRLPGNERTVIEGAGWSQHLSDILRDYIEHSVASLADVQVVSEGGLDIKVSCRIGVKVWAMELVPADSRAGDEVEVALQFSMVRLADGELLGQPVFAETEPVRSTSSGAVVEAFSTAMNRAANRYGAWVKETSGACTR